MLAAVYLMSTFQPPATTRSSTRCARPTRAGRYPDLVRGLSRLRKLPFRQDSRIADTNPEDTKAFTRKQVARKNRFRLWLAKIILRFVVILQVFCHAPARVSVQLQRTFLALWVQSKSRTKAVISILML